MFFLDYLGLNRLWLHIVNLVNMKTSNITTDNITQGNDELIFFCGGAPTNE